MGLGGISIWQLLIVLAIVLVIFGAKKLRNAGGDLGQAVKNFKKAVRDDQHGNDTQHQTFDNANENDRNKSS